MSSNNFSAYTIESVDGLDLDHFHSIAYGEIADIDVEDFKKIYALYEEHGIIRKVTHKGATIGLFGLVPMDNEACNIWAIYTKDFLLSNIKEAMWVSKDILESYLRNIGFKRFVISFPENYEKNIRWAKAIGFQDAEATNGATTLIYEYI